MPEPALEAETFTVVVVWNATQRQAQPVTHLTETIATVILFSAARVSVSFHKLDPCPDIWKVSYSLGKGRRSGSSQGGPVPGPHRHCMGSVERERETLIEKRERESDMGEQMEAKRSGTDCPPGGEGERQGEEHAHPSSPLPDQLLLQD